MKLDLNGHHTLKTERASSVLSMRSTYSTTIILQYVRMLSGCRRSPRLKVCQAHKTLSDGAIPFRQLPYEKVDCWFPMMCKWWYKNEYQFHYRQWNCNIKVGIQYFEMFFLAEFHLSCCRWLIIQYISKIWKFFSKVKKFKFYLSVHKMGILRLIIFCVVAYYSSIPLNQIVTIYRIFCRFPICQDSKELQNTSLGIFHQTGIIEGGSRYTFLHHLKEAQSDFFNFSSSFYMEPFGVTRKLNFFSYPMANFTA